jgi:peroxiredoxin family protein
MQTMATSMMKGMFKQKGVAQVQELIDAALDLDVNLIACQMTMDVFGFEQEEFIDGVQFGGAAAFLSEARKSHVTLFI